MALWLNRAGKRGEFDRAIIRMTWENMGRLCDATLFAYTEVLYPTDRCKGEETNC